MSEPIGGIDQNANATVASHGRSPATDALRLLNALGSLRKQAALRPPSTQSP